MKRTPEEESIRRDKWMELLHAVRAMMNEGRIPKTSSFIHRYVVDVEEALKEFD